MPYCPEDENLEDSPLFKELLKKAFESISKDIDAAAKRASDKVKEDLKPIRNQE